MLQILALSFITKLLDKCLRMHLTAYEMIENAKKGLHRGKGRKHFISNMVKYVRYSK